MGESVGLQFSYRMSYARWVELGFDVRERAYHAALRDQGYEVMFISYDERSRSCTTEEGIACCGLARGRTGARIPMVDYLFELTALLRVISQKEIGIIKTCQFTGAFHAVPAKLITGCKIIVRCGYGWMLGRLRRKKSFLHKAVSFPAYWLLEFVAFLFADQIIVTSDAHARHLACLFPFFKGKCTFIRNYIDTGAYRSVYTSRNGKVLFVGRLLTHKNVAPLIRACASCGLELVIAGSGDDEERLRTIADEAQGKVTFVGQLGPAEVCALMQICSYFVLPSLYEGSPKALLEAMASAMVVVAAKVMGSEELIEDGVNGFLCDPTERSIAQTLQRAGEMGAARAEEMGKKAREFVVENCSFEAVMRQEVTVMRRLNKG